MKRKLFINILKISGATLFILATVLAVHIYKVTRPGKADASTVSLARIDFKQQLSKEDSAKIVSWLYKQKGVENVLCNPISNIAVFSFRPVQNNATLIAQNLAFNLNYKAERYMPSAQDLKGSCPVK